MFRYDLTAFPALTLRIRSIDRGLADQLSRTRRFGTSGEGKARGREYMGAIKDWCPKKPEKSGQRQANFASITASLRKLIAFAASTLLERMLQTMSRLDWS